MTDKRHTKNTSWYKADKDTWYKHENKSYIIIKNFPLQEAYYKGHPKADTKMTHTARKLMMWLESTKDGETNIELQGQRKKILEDGRCT